MQIRWQKRAIKDLVNLQKYIARERPRVAAQISVKIRRAIGLLSNQPQMGRPGRVEGTRELIVPGTP